MFLIRAEGLAVLLTCASACAATVTPDAIRAADVTAERRAETLTLWTAAIDQANAFLESDFRATLPPGRFVLSDAEGMRFVTAERTWPLRVECTTWGDVCVRTGFDAQERSWGFVVGQRAPKADRRVDNSLFRDAGGNLGAPARTAALILHETTHTVYHQGTVGFWTGLVYYLEAVFLFRYDSHSAERRANGTSEEFQYFRQSRGQSDEQFARTLTVFEAHLAQPTRKTCRHGPPAPLTP